MSPQKENTILFLTSLTSAQNIDSTQVIVPKVQEHDFEGVEIDGVLYKPGGFLENAF